MSHSKEVRPLGDYQEIGHRWKCGNAWSLVILIGRGLDPKAGERKRPEGKREGLTRWRRSGCAVLRVRARRRKRGACGGPGKREEARSPERIPVTMAKGIHLFPYRTQKLSLSAPRVLAWRRAGRVGRCRIPNEKARSLDRAFSFSIRQNPFPGHTQLMCNIVLG